jgi:hypothetical protein
MSQLYELLENWQIAIETQTKIFQRKVFIGDF